MNPLRGRASNDPAFLNMPDDIHKALSSIDKRLALIEYRLDAYEKQREKRSATLAALISLVVAAVAQLAGTVWK